MTIERGRWLITSDAGWRPRARLVCLPYAGAGASLFRRWPRSAPEGVQLCRVQLPGREERVREPFVTSMPELLSALRIELGDGPPTSIFGHGLGGLIAFELARSLHEAGATPLRLILSGTRPPHVPDPHQLHLLPEPEFFEALRRRSGTYEDILRRSEHRELFGPMLRADLTLAETWRRDEPLALPVPITVCASKDDAVVAWDDTALWSLYTTAGFERKEFPGDHYFAKEHDELMMSVVFAKVLESVEGK